MNRMLVMRTRAEAVQQRSAHRDCCIDARLLSQLCTFV